MRNVVAASVLMSAGVVASASASTLVVGPGQPNGWTGYTTDNFTYVLGTGSGTADFVNGPATPPLGTGSGHLQTPPGLGDEGVQWRNTNHAGVRIDQLTALSYSTYATAWNGQQLPWLTIWVDTDGVAGWDDRMQFEPDYSSGIGGNPVAALNTWQTWNTLTGQWYSDNHAGPGSNTISLAAYLLLEPNATIVNAAPGLGGVRLASGYASGSDNFDTNIDNFTLAFDDGAGVISTTYDFEAVVPEPASMGLLALGATVLLRRRK